jgi:hypothetical protein
MNRLRSSAAGVVRRKIPSNLVISTFFGQKLNTKTCECCGETKYISEFYLESSSKRKYADQVRKQCVVCWDKYKGANPSYEEYEDNRNQLTCQLISPLDNLS